jgi:hypothetical protein
VNSTGGATGAPNVDRSPVFGHRSAPRSRLFAQPVPGRTGDAAEAFHLRRGDRQFQRAASGNLDGQIVGHRGTPRAEPGSPTQGT